MGARMIGTAIGGLLVLLLVAASASAAVNTFDGGAIDNSWNRAANWSDGIPGADDQVVIPLFETAQLDSRAAGVADSISLGGSLVVGGPSLTLTGASSSSFGGNVNVNSAGQFVLDGDVTWSAGVWHISNATITNAGTLNVTGADPTVARQGFSTDRLVNTGTINRTAGTGTMTVAPPLRSSGTVNVGTGTVAPTAGATIESGSVTIASGTALGAAGQTIGIDGGTVGGGARCSGPSTTAGARSRPARPPACSRWTAPTCSGRPAPSRSKWTGRRPARAMIASW